MSMKAAGAWLPHQTKPSSGNVPAKPLPELLLHPLRSMTRVAAQAMCAYFIAAGAAPMPHHVTWEQLNTALGILCNLTAPPWAYRSFDAFWKKIRSASLAGLASGILLTQARKISQTSNGKTKCLLGAVISWCQIRAWFPTEAVHPEDYSACITKPASFRLHHAAASRQQKIAEVKMLRALKPEDPGP
eukprot:485788-Amphidinium_carterae.1